MLLVRDQAEEVEEFDVQDLALAGAPNMHGALLQPRLERRAPHRVGVSSR